MRNARIPAVIALFALAALPACVGEVPEGELTLDDSSEGDASETGSLFAVPQGIITNFSSNTPTLLTSPFITTYWPTATWPTLYVTGRVNQSTDSFFIAVDATRPGTFSCGGYTKMYHRWNGAMWWARAETGGSCSVTISSYGNFPGEPIIGTYHGWLNYSGVLKYRSGSFNVPRGPDVRAFGVTRPSLSGCDNPSSSTPPYTNCGIYDGSGRRVCYCSRASQRISEAFFASSTDLLHHRSVYPNQKVLSAGPTPYSNSLPYWVKRTY